MNPRTGRIHTRFSQTVAATEEILTDNGVRAQGSPDMMKIWQGK